MQDEQLDLPSSRFEAGVNQSLNDFVAKEFNLDAVKRGTTIYDLTDQIIEQLQAEDPAAYSALLEKHLSFLDLQEALSESNALQGLDARDLMDKGILLADESIDEETPYLEAQRELRDIAIEVLKNTDNTDKLGVIYLSRAIAAGIKASWLFDDASQWGFDFDLDKAIEKQDEFDGAKENNRAVSTISSQ